MAGMSSGQRKIGFGCPNSANTSLLSLQAVVCVQLLEEKAKYYNEIQFCTETQAEFQIN